VAARRRPISTIESEGFDAVERAAWGGLIAIHGRLMHEVAEDLRITSGLTHPEFEVLLRLSFAPDHRIRIQDLAAESILTASGMSRVVSRLEARALVVRHRAEEDGRGAYAELTDTGASAFEAAATHHMRFVRDAFLSKYTKAELRLMGDLWTRLDPKP
jgi:DNA-binding MarR family transcriptional regulator